MPKNRRHATYLFATILVFAISCTPRISSVSGSAEKVTISLSKKTKDSFNLRIASSGRIIASSTPDGYTVSFNLPSSQQDFHAMPCLQVTDNKDNPISLEGEIERSTFLNRLWIKLIEAEHERKLALELANKKKIIIRELNEQLKIYSQSLGQSTAFNERNCTLPQTRATPQRPESACTQEDYHQKAIAICLASNGGPEACTQTVQYLGDQLDLDIYNFLTSPACGKMVSDLLGENYSSEHFLQDFAIGAGLDFGEALAGSENWAESILGYLVIGAAWKIKLEKFDTCISKASSACRRLHQRWLEDVRYIQDEPQIELQECNNNLGWHSWLTATLSIQDPEYRELKVLLSQKEMAVNEIKARPSALLPPCSMKSDPLPPSPRDIVENNDKPTQYRLGLSFQYEENLTYEGHSYTGLKIVELSPMHPAQKAGMKPGDIIHRINRKRIPNIDFLSEQVQLSGGSDIELDFFRGNAKGTAKLRPVQGRIGLGIVAEDTSHGPRVITTLSKFPAARSGIKPGDIIFIINGSSVNNVNELIKITHESGEVPIGVMYSRNGKTSLTATTPIFIAEGW